jgi:hypothetical protein
VSQRAVGSDRYRPTGIACVRFVVWHASLRPSAFGLQPKLERTKNASFGNHLDRMSPKLSLHLLRAILGISLRSTRTEAGHAAEHGDGAGLHPLHVADDLG